MTIFHSEMSDQEIIKGLKIIQAETAYDEDVAEAVALDLVESGSKYRPIENSVTADVASTGGPTSLSTLLTPLFLRVAGMKIPKLGVPGRPAGGIDCLSQIPGYQTRLSREGIDHALAHAGYAHFESNDEYAPLDARVFRLRQQIGAQQVPTLVVASLLAKKLAVGIQYAGLDIRVSPFGNFGADWKDAERNARLFMAVAKRLKIHPRAVLTDGRFPYQPYLGRRESLLALSEIFHGQPDSWLLEHFEQLRQMAIAVVPADRRPLIADASRERLLANFLLNIEAQGANERDYFALVDETRGSHSVELKAIDDGFVSYPLSGIRDEFVSIQRKSASSENPYSDPVGLILKQRVGTWVKRGELIATLRVQQCLDPGTIAAVLTPQLCVTAAQPSNSTMEGF